MNGLQEKTLHQLTGKSNISTIDAEELFNLTLDYPYFSVAQFFLSQKMQVQKQLGFIPQVQKTALYFNNLNLLHYQLLNHSPEIKIVHKKEDVEPTEPLLKKVIEEEIKALQLKNTTTVEASNMQIPTVESIKQMLYDIKDQKIKREIDAQDEIVETAEAQHESITSFALAQSENETEAKNVTQQEEIIEEIVETKPKEVEPVIEIIDTPIEPTITTQQQEIIEENDIQLEQVIDPTPQEVEPVIEIIDTPIEATITTQQEEIIEENNIQLEQIIDPTPQEIVPAIEIIDTEVETINSNQNEEIKEADRLQIEEITEHKQEEATKNYISSSKIETIKSPKQEDILLQDEKIASILKEQLKEFKKPVEANAVLPLTPESYHTVDYFASQGIKPEFGQNGQDKLSKQLRKFTDWLKHMKNDVPNTDDLGTDPELETAIQDIAKISNEAKEIVTETMAEVLEKQGKKDKAIQLYIKLSFLNPDKSAYFASKIQHLKGI